MRRIGLIAVVGLVMVCFSVGWQWHSRRENAARRMAAWEAEREEDVFAPEFAQEFEWPRGELTLDEFGQLVTAKSGLVVEIEYDAISGDWRADVPRRLRKVSVPRGTFTLGALLKMVLTPEGLCADGRGKSVVITSVMSSVEQSRVRSRVYPVPQGVKGLSESDWKDLIWSNLDGQVEALPGAVVVVGNVEAQRRARLVIETVESLRKPKAPSVTILPENESPGDRRIIAVLDQPVDLSVVEMPLKDVALYLAETYSVPLVLMADKLSEASVSVDIPITKSLEDISLRSALNLIMRDLELTFIVRDGAVVITTPEDEHARIVAHWVRDLVELPEGGLDTTPLCDLIQGCIRPDQWDTGSGPSQVQSLENGWILFEQHPYAHEETAALLTGMRKILATSGVAEPVQPPPPSEATEKIYAALDREIEVSCEQLPLKDVVLFFAESLKIPIGVSIRRLEESSVGLDSPVTFYVPRARAGLGLELLLYDLELAFVVGDEVLQITTRKDAESQLVTRLYDVRSLVESKLLKCPIEDLVRQVQPQSWDTAGGPGTCQVYRGILVVCQTQAAQERTIRLLDALRKCDGELARPHAGDLMLIRDEPTAEQVRLESALEQVVNVDLESRTLGGALKELAEEHKLPLVLERRVYRQARISFRGFDVTVAPLAAEMTLSGALDRLLLPNLADYSIRENVIWITNRGEAQARFETRLYRIDDLAAKGTSVDEIQQQVAAVVKNARQALVGSTAALIDSISPHWLIVAASRSQQEDVADWIYERRTGKTPRRAEERRALYEKMIAGEL